MLYDTFAVFAVTYPTVAEIDKDLTAAEKQAADRT
jgi:hypothetical protein